MGIPNHYLLGSSPRLWGCFHPHWRIARDAFVFPTPVGVFPPTRPATRDPARLPHACGGVSVVRELAVLHRASSPRLWGCFRAVCDGHFSFTVFPTPVGVFLGAGRVLPGRFRLPHACGGVSGCEVGQQLCVGSSPRLWGCFPKDHRAHPRGVVFPTPVGVFPSEATRRSATCGLPHACGGVSAIAQVARSGRPSSPRLWGCFHARLANTFRLVVFPTPVGVFPWAATRTTAATSLPHACGGVSWERWVRVRPHGSSPRLWGCFVFPPAHIGQHRVFPTPVGVFPFAPLPFGLIPCLPHARGGVSSKTS